MKKKLLFSLIGGLVVFTLAVPALAASSDFLIQAQEAYSKYCTKSNSPLNQALGCYAFEKTQELQNQLDAQETTNNDQNTQIASLNSSIVNLQLTEEDSKSRIESLESRVTDLETANESLISSIEELINNQTKPSEELDIFNWGWRNNGDESSIIDTQNHQLLILKGKTQYESPTVDIYYSDDQVNWQKQGWIYIDLLNVFNNKDFIQVFKVEGKYYKAVVSTNGATSFFYLQGILN